MKKALLCAVAASLIFVGLWWYQGTRELKLGIKPMSPISLRVLPAPTPAIFKPRPAPNSSKSPNSSTVGLTAEQKKEKKEKWLVALAEANKSGKGTKINVSSYIEK